MIRLHVEANLEAGHEVPLGAGQGHYLAAVMRRGVGARVLLFNGRDGEWQARIAAADRKAVRLRVEARTRAQQAEPDLWLAFALLKRDATDLVVQKATELGVAALLPVTTERSQAARVNEDRLRAIAIEAAEQSERLTVPRLHAVQKLDAALAGWPPARPLCVAMEREDAPLPAATAAAAGMLVGPEGGWAPGERALLRGMEFVRPVSLGPRILRAETAAIVGLALLQAGLWR